MLYHVSTDISLQEKTFVPRIPKFRLWGEDYSLKRFCVSNSLENCIASFPYKSGLANRLYSIPLYLAVYSFDESDLPEGSLRKPQDVERFVGDAIEKQEHWITKEITVKPTLIRLRKLQLSRYCKYTGEYGGDVTEFEYEKDTELYERVEKATFFHRKHFKQFQKACERHGIELQEVSTTKEHMQYCGYMTSTRVYTVTRVTYTIPSNISANPVWEIIAKEFRKNRRKHLCFNEQDFM